jgi:hypothetical protein
MDVNLHLLFTHDGGVVCFQSWLSWFVLIESLDIADTSA